MSHASSSQRDGDEPRDLVLGKVNCSIATTPLPATTLQAFVPFYTQPRHQPFIARNAWKVAINGIRALRRLKGVSGGVLEDSSTTPTHSRLDKGIGASTPSKRPTTGTGANGHHPLRSDLVVASGHKGRVLLWNADSLSSLNTTERHGGGTVTQLIVTNTRVISIIERDHDFRGSGGGSDNEIMLWDMTSMRLEATLSAHEERATCVAVDAENENHILSGSNDKTVLEWILPNLNPVARYVGHSSAVSQLCFVFGGKYFMSGSYDSTLKVWASEVKERERVEVSATSRPPRNLGSAKRNNSIRLVEGGLQRTDSAKALRFASVREAAALYTVEGHMGQITCLENMSDEGNISQKRPSSASSRLMKAMSDSATQRTISVVSACNGGVVKCVSLTFEYIPEGEGDGRGKKDAAAPLFAASSASPLSGGFCGELYSKSLFSLTGAPQQQWSNKAHRALVKDVCWDGHVVVSASLSDGLSFFNTQARVTNKISFGVGVRHLAIDTMRRLLVAGCENGQLAFYNYDGFYALGQYDHHSYQSKQQETNDDTVVLAATYQPHTANITGMLLERTINGQWERLITTSSDSTFFVMDFDTNRDSRSYSLLAGGSPLGASALFGRGSIAHPTATATTASTSNTLTAHRSSASMGSFRFGGAKLPQSITLAQSVANRITPIAGCGSFLLAVGGGASAWDILRMEKRAGVGKSITLRAATQQSASADLNSIPDVERITPTDASGITHMAGSVAKALSRQSTPPPDTLSRRNAEPELGITCCAYYPSVSKAVIGAENNTIHFYSVGVEEPATSPTGGTLSPVTLDLDGPGSPPRKFANPNDHTRTNNRALTPTAAVPASYNGAAGSGTLGAAPRSLEEYIRAPTKAPLGFENGMFLRKMSSECVEGSIVACCLERGSGANAYRSGGVTLVDLVAERQITATYPLTLVPIDVKLFSYQNEGSVGRDVRVSNKGYAGASGGLVNYIVLVQLRNGQIVLLTGSSASQTLIQQQTVLKEQIPYYPDREAEGQLPTPTPMFASLNTAYYPPRLDVIVVEKGVLRSVVVPPTPEGEIIHQCALPFFEMVNVTASLAAAIPVVTWAPMRLSGYLAAVALENGTVTLVTEAIERDGPKIPIKATPDVLREYRPIDIYHSGAVADHVLEKTSRRQRRCYVNSNGGADPTNVVGPSSSGSGVVQCTSLSVSPHARLLALGYSDGVIQLWDFATRRVCRRINAHSGSPILHVSIFSREHRLVSISSRELRFDTLYGRNINEPRTSALDEEEGREGN